MKKVTKKLNLNKQVVTKLNHITGGVTAPPVTYTCTATKPSATTCAFTTCVANTCANTCADSCGDSCINCASETCSGIFPTC